MGTIQRRQVSIVVEKAYDLDSDTVLKLLKKPWKTVRQDHFLGRVPGSPDTDLPLNLTKYPYMDSSRY